MRFFSEFQTSDKENYLLLSLLLLMLVMTLATEVIATTTNVINPVTENVLSYVITHFFLGFTTEM